MPEVLSRLTIPKQPTKQEEAARLADIPPGGTPGQSAVIIGATAVSVPAGSNPTVTVGGTPQARTFEFGVPSGFNGKDGEIGPIHSWFGTCVTAAGTALKISTITNFVRRPGTIVTVRFSVGNTAAVPVLDVSETGAAEIRYNGQPITGALLTVGDHVFQFDGTFWNWLNHPRLPWVSGYFQNRSLPGGAVTILTPVYEKGDNSLLSGNTFRALVDGRYLLSVGGGGLSPVSGSLTSPQTQSLIFKDATMWEWPKLEAIDVYVGGYWLIPSLAAVVDMAAGTSVAHWIYVHHTISTINENGSKHKFVFMRVS